MMISSLMARRRGFFLLLVILPILSFCWYGQAFSLSTTTTTSFVFRRRHDDEKQQQVQHFPKFNTILKSSNQRSRRRIRSIVSLKASIEPQQEKQQEGPPLVVENSSLVEQQLNGDNNKEQVTTTTTTTTTSDGEISKTRQQVFFAQEVVVQEKELSISTKEEENDDEAVQVSVANAAATSANAVASSTSSSSSSSSVDENVNDLRTAEALFDYDSAYVVFSSAIIGIICGFAVAVFKLSIETLREGLYGGSLAEHFYWWLIPALGGVGVSILAATGELSPGLRGTANEIDTLSLNVKEDLRFKDAARFLRKPLAAIITLGSGCSLGPEGPSVEVGMTMSRLCMPPSIQRSERLAEVDAAARLRRNRLLLSAGAAAGVAAGFNAPLSGVFFALEILQQNLPPLTISGANGGPLSSDRNQPDNWQQQVQQDYLSSGSSSITSILLASVLSALVSQVYLGEELALSVPSYQLNTPLVELPMYLLLGVVSGVVAGTFTALAQASKAFFDGEAGPPVVQETMKNLPDYTKPVLGGLACGIIGLVFPQVLFFGYETLNTLLAKNAMPTTLILSLLAAKTVATAISAGSGLVGGTFAPSLFLGGMTGAAFHNIVAQMFIVGHASPFELADVQAYALVGAAGVLSALFRAPLTASLLLFELTRDYNVILPLMATAGVGSVVGDVVEKALEETRRDRDAVSWGDLADGE